MLKMKKNFFILGREYVLTSRCYEERQKNCAIEEPTHRERLHRFKATSKAKCVSHGRNFCSRHMGLHRPQLAVDIAAKCRSVGLRFSRPQTITEEKNGSTDHCGAFSENGDASTTL